MVFICHSTSDKEFVNKLYARLATERVKVWFDALEIKVGDSLIGKIEAGLATMDYLAVVLTPESVASQWCKEELRAAMSRQIKERRTVVLPILFKDCDIPMFLAEKKYADFREDFEVGLKDLLATLQTAINLSAGKISTPKYETDFAWDYGLAEDPAALPYEHLYFQIDAVSFSKADRFSVLSRFMVRGNEVTTRRFRTYAREGLEHVGAAIMLGMLGDVLDTNDNFVLVEKGDKVVTTAKVGDTKTGMRFLIGFEMRRLGEPVETVMFHWGSIFSRAFSSVKERALKLTDEEHLRLRKVISTPIS